MGLVRSEKIGHLVLNEYWDHFLLQSTGKDSEFESKSVEEGNAKIKDGRH